MDLDKAFFLRWYSSIQNEVMSLRESFRVRGPRVFIRPLGLGTLVVFSAYWYVYKTTGEMMLSIEKDLAATQATAQFAEEYKNLRARLEGLYARLPKTRNPGDWLLGAVRRSLRREGIVPLSISPPDEQTSEAYRFISMKVKFKANYRQVGSWVSRIERGTELLFVKDLRITKDKRPIGNNTVDVTVTTVAPMSARTTR